MDKFMNKQFKMKCKFFFNCQLILGFYALFFTNCGNNHIVGEPCPYGRYPNGKNCYLCLGCHPCPSLFNEDDFCDNASNDHVLYPANIFYYPVKTNNPRIAVNGLWGYHVENNGGCVGLGIYFFRRASQKDTSIVKFPIEDEFLGEMTIQKVTKNQLKILLRISQYNMSPKTIMDFDLRQVEILESGFPKEIATDLLKNLDLPSTNEEIVFKPSMQKYEMINSINRDSSFSNLLLISQRTNCIIGDKKFDLQVLTVAEGPVSMQLNIKRPKVKCNCSENVYGKDKETCDRICDFLKNNGSTSGY